jgi:hypothetical protein
MRAISTWLPVVILALGSRTLTAQVVPPAPTPAGGAALAPPASTSPMAAVPSPSPIPTLVDDVIRLWKANLSENFLRKYVSMSEVAKELTAEDIVRLRNAGLPESLILEVTQKKLGLAASPTPAGPGLPAAAVAPAPTPVPTPRTTARWEGLVRRNSGIVLFKSRWDPGILEFKDDTLRWTDAKDVTKNLLIPEKSLTEQQLTCLKKASGLECFEWVVRTRTDEFRFRNVGWEQNENADIEDVFAFLKKLHPNLVSSRMPVNEK